MTGTLAPSRRHRDSTVAHEPDPTHERVALDLERSEILAKMEEREADARRHTLWAVLGVSPGAVLPLFVSLDDIAPIALLLIVVFMAGFEFWRAHRAKEDVLELRRELRRLRTVEAPTGPLRVE